MTSNENKICKKVAELFAEKDWHELSWKEREIVTELEQAGYLIRNNPTNGFVGKCA
jgi:hypothetical protein